MKRLTTLPVWQQYALAVAYIVPWIVFGLISTDVPPEAWRFQAWPESIRAISIWLFGIFIFADTVFALWFLFSQSRDDAA